MSEPALIEDRVVVGRKEHGCEWCPDPIEVGLAHAMWRYIDDGAWMTMRMHRECLTAFHDSSDPLDAWAWICTDGQHGRGEQCNH